MSHVQAGITAGLRMANFSKNKDKADEIQAAGWRRIRPEQGIITVM